MGTNVSNPGRPAYTNIGAGRQATDRIPYLAWTLDVEPWMDQALCDPSVADMWFSDHKAERDWALAVCQECPVRRECLERQLKLEKHTRPEGIAGGMTAEQRAQLLRRPLPPAPTTATRETCGTPYGRKQHYRHKEPVCEPCRHADAAYNRERRAAKRAGS